MLRISVVFSYNPVATQPATVFSCRIGSHLGSSINTALVVGSKRSECFSSFGTFRDRRNLEDIGDGFILHALSFVIEDLG